MPCRIKATGQNNHPMAGHQRMLTRVCLLTGPGGDNLHQAGYRIALFQASHRIGMPVACNLLIQMEPQAHYL